MVPEGPEGGMAKVDSIHPGPFHFLNRHNLKKKKSEGKEDNTQESVVKFDWKGTKS